MVKNARRRFTCENASKCVHFCRSRCCFAHAMDAKIAQNRRKLTTKCSQKMRRPVLQWSETHAVERLAKMQQNAFISVVPGVALLTPWTQKSMKTVENHRWGHVRCLRSGPPRGGPIRSVSFHRKGTGAQGKRAKRGPANPASGCRPMGSYENM